MLLFTSSPSLSLQIGSNFVEFSSVSAFSGFWKRSTEIYCVCCDCFTCCCCCCCCLWAPENETRAWTELGWDLSCVEHLRPWPLSFAAVHLIAVRPSRPHTTPAPPTKQQQHHQQQQYIRPHSQTLDQTRQAQRNRTEPQRTQSQIHFHFHFHFQFRCQYPFAARHCCCCWPRCCCLLNCFSFSLLFLSLFASFKLGRILRLIYHASVSVNLTSTVALSVALYLYLQLWLWLYLHLCMYLRLYLHCATR